MPRVIVLCVALASSVSGAPAQGAAPPVFFALSVADLDASVKWYSETFDLTVTRLPKVAPAKVALLQGNGLVVELVEHPGAFDLKARLPELEKPYLAHGLFKVGFFVADLDGIVTRLKARGAVFKGRVFTDPVLGARSILLLDNSGNMIQLFEPASSE